MLDTRPRSGAWLRNRCIKMDIKNARVNAPLRLEAVLNRKYKDDVESTQKTGLELKECLTNFLRKIFVGGLLIARASMTY